MTVRNVRHAESRNALVFAGLKHILLDFLTGLLLTLSVCGAGTADGTPYNFFFDICDIIVIFTLDVFSGISVALTNVLCKLGSIAQRTNDMLHVVGLAIDEAAEVNDNTLGLVALTRKVGVGMLELGNFLLVALALSFKLFGNFLLENESLESIITLLLSARKTESKTSNVVLLLVDEGGETAVFTLMVLDLDLEFRGFFGELLSERLEFEELQRVSIV